MSGRASGSPPVKSACRTPSWAACWKTRDQVSVGSSSARAVSSSGLRAVDAMEWAAVGEFGDEREGIGGGHFDQHPNHHRRFSGF